MASHYLSFTRLVTEGRLTVDGEAFEVAGFSWMDQEFSTMGIGREQVGWDWVSIQLDDGSEVMLYQARERGGGADPYSHGTYIGPDGTARHLPLEEFQMIPGRIWKYYPVEWEIHVWPLELTLKVTPMMDDQELVSKGRITQPYWEGAVDFDGVRAGKPVKGHGYLEMTGYESPLRIPEVE